MVDSSHVFSRIDHVFQMYVGFSGSTHDGCAGTHTIHDWQISTDFTPRPPPPPSPNPSPAPSPGNSTPSNSPGLKAQTIAGISLVATGGFLFALFTLLICLRSKRLRLKNTSGCGVLHSIMCKFLGTSPGGSRDFLDL